MAQFDIFQAKDGELFLDVQTDLLGAFNTRVVIPLIRPNEGPVRHPRLNPIVAFDGVDYVMATQFIIALDRHEMGHRVGTV